MSSSQRSFSIVVVFQNVGKFLFRTIIFPDTKSTPVWRTRTANIAISIDTIEQLLVLSCPIRSLGGFCVLSVPDDSASLRKSFSSSVSRGISAYYLRSQPDSQQILLSPEEPDDHLLRRTSTFFCPRRSRTTIFCAGGASGGAGRPSVPGGAGRPSVPGGAGRPSVLSPAEPADTSSAPYYRRRSRTAIFCVLSPDRSLLASTVPGQEPPVLSPDRSLQYYPRTGAS